MLELCLQKLQASTEDFLFEILANIYLKPPFFEYLLEHDFFLALQQ